MAVQVGEIGTTMAVDRSFLLVLLRMKKVRIVIRREERMLGGRVGAIVDGPRLIVVVVEMVMIMVGVLVGRRSEGLEGLGVAEAILGSFGGKEMVDLKPGGGGSGVEGELMMRSRSGATVVGEPFGAAARAGPAKWERGEQALIDRRPRRGRGLVPRAADRGR